MKLQHFPYPAPSTPPVRSAYEAVLVGDSDAFRYMRLRLEQVAPTDATVLLLGETGTGKGIAARIIHQLSHRREAPDTWWDGSSVTSQRTSACDLRLMRTNSVAMLARAGDGSALLNVRRTRGRGAARMERTLS